MPPLVSPGRGGERGGFSIASLAFEVFAGYSG